LSQQTEGEGDKPVAYFSRKLLPREEKYSTVEKECLAIRLAIHAFRVYLMGRAFTIQTDHRSLEWLDRVKENNARLTSVYFCNHTNTQWSTGQELRTVMQTLCPVWHTWT